MTSARLVDPLERLDRIDFTGEHEWHDHAVQLGAYTCPRCGHRLGLRPSDLHSHDYAPSDNLEAPWPALFDVARADRPSEWESHLDFHCPGCHAPVRLVYAQGPEWAMGAHPWRITAVLEAAEWPDEGPEVQGESL